MLQARYCPGYSATQATQLQDHVLRTSSADSQLTLFRQPVQVASWWDLLQAQRVIIIQQQHTLDIICIVVLWAHWSVAVNHHVAYVLR
jgi:hypothetical protein